jgi:hypothetical protein
MSFLPLALVTSAVSALYFVVADLCVHLLSRGRFGFRALHVAVGSRVVGWVLFMGCAGVCAFSAPQPNPAVKRDVALKRVAPYF